MTGGRLIITAIVLVLLATGCGKNESDNAFSRQEQNIEAIVKSLTSGDTEATVDYLSGSVRVTVAHGEGEALREGGTVSLKYAGYIISGSSLGAGNLFVTNDKDFAESSNWTVTDSTLFKTDTFVLDGDNFVKGLRTGLAGVKAGDECYVMFSGKHGFGKHAVGAVPKNSALAYHLWIGSVSN